MKAFTGGDYYFTAENNLTSQKAMVTEILDHNYNDDGSILFSCKLLNGSGKGEIINAVQFTDSYLGESVRLVEKGDKIYLDDATSYNIGVDWFLYEYERFNGIVWLALAFAVLLLIFGKKKGFTTILSIAYTIMTIFLVFIPAVLSGYNIYICAIALCIFITLMSLLIVQGPNAKCYADALGCFGGLFVISGITLLMSSLLKITGLVLAYIGSSLSLLLLVLVNTGSSTELLNSELIIVEMLQALAGSIGILFTIPLTALSYSILCNASIKNRKKINWVVCQNSGDWLLNVCGI